MIPMMMDFVRDEAVDLVMDMAQERAELLINDQVITQVAGPARELVRVGIYEFVMLRSWVRLGRPIREQVRDRVRGIPA